MCEYLCGSLRVRQDSGYAVRRRLKEEVARRAYNLQLDDEIPAQTRAEITRLAPHAPPKLLFSLTTSTNHDCIEESLERELRADSKLPLKSVSVFRCLERIIELAKPDVLVLILVEGASSGWEPLKRRGLTLREFFELVYEYRDRPDKDVNGVYDMTEW